MYMYSYSEIDIIVTSSKCRTSEFLCNRHTCHDVHVEEKINYRTACTCMLDTLCVKLVRGILVRVLPKCRPMIVYKKEKIAAFIQALLVK